jgi:hypothetical protein
MKLATGWVSLAVGIFLALLVQDGIPAISGLNGARVLLVPMLFCYGALAFPTWAMLLLAAYTGFVCDLKYLNVVDHRVEIALGWSMVYFVIFGLVAHGFQPGFQRGHWWLHPLLSAAGTVMYLALQFVMISFRREALVFNEVILWKILGPGLVAAVIAPLFYLAVFQISHLLPFPREREYANRR